MLPPLPRLPDTNLVDALSTCYFLHFSFYCNMRLIQFNVYFNHRLHIFMLNYITYIVCVLARKITKSVAYVPCVRAEDNTVL